MPTTAETCTHCHKPIPTHETPYLLAGDVVCSKCYRENQWLNEPPKPSSSSEPLICANCDGKIGRLEGPSMWQGKCVCLSCYQRLAAPREAARTVAYARITNKKPSTTGPTLLTIAGFLPFIAALIRGTEAIQSGVKVEFWVGPVLILGGLLTVAGLAWFVTVRLQRE